MEINEILDKANTDACDVEYMVDCIENEELRIRTREYLLELKELYMFLHGALSSLDVSIDFEFDQAKDEPFLWIMDKMEVGVNRDDVHVKMVGANMITNKHVLASMIRGIAKYQKAKNSNRSRLAA